MATTPTIPIADRIEPTKARLTRLRPTTWPNTIQAAIDAVTV
jgi:hypothetical protein